MIWSNIGFNNEVRSQDIKFNHITPDQGFGFGNVWDVLEDHEGFMWFGTEDGLVKYDGYTLVNYKNNKADSTSISANFIMTLIEDRYNQLWIGTFGGGLNMYDYNTDSFHRFRKDSDNPYSLPHNRVKALIESHDGKIWLGTEGAGIVSFDPDPEKRKNLNFEKFEHPLLNQNDPNALMIRSICEDRVGSIYFGTLSGVIILDSDRKNITQLRKGNEYPNLLSSDVVLEVFVDSKERLWIGTIDSGLDLYLPDQQEVINYAPSKNSNTLKHVEIGTVTEDQNGSIWIGSDNGLSKFENSHEPVPENRFTNYFHQSLNENSLLSNSVKVVFVDSRNTLWAGTYYGGINAYNPNLYKFNPIRHKPWVASSLSHDNVTAFAEDKAGNLWIGTDGGGVNVLKNPVKNIFKDNFIKIDIKRSRNQAPETKVKTMKFDHDGNLWIGFWVGGLYRHNPLTGKSMYFGPDDQTSSGLLGIRILALEVDENNNLWVATFDQGISHFDQSTGKFKNYLPTNDLNTGVKGERFNALLIDSKNKIWAGGDLGGLNVYDEESDSFERVESGNILTGNISILSLSENSQGEICIGTVASGLIIYDPVTKAVKNHTEDSGLPNNVIHAIREDASGNMWLGTNLGLSVLSTSSGAVTNYTRVDGLQGNQFNNGSSYQLSDGMMLFGGTNGWNAFYPDSIKNIDTSSKIVYTNFWVNGKEVELSDPNTILDAHLNSGAPINLHHDQKSFTVEFAILDFDFTGLNQYSYFLEGFDTEWQNIGTDRKAVFTNLSPGDYQLRVKATNHDGFSVEKPDTLSINIIPAWWQTRLFKISVFLLVTILIYLIYRVRINFLVNQSKKLERIVEQRTSEIKSKGIQLHEKNNEIQAQNEELFAQNEQIHLQRDELSQAHSDLRNINEKLEDLVKQRTAKLETTIRQLDKTVMELDRFVYSASHDLSAPLKSVKGLIQILVIEKEPERIKSCIQHMIKSIDGLEAVIKSLVDYSKNAHKEVENSPVNCQHELNLVLEELRYLPGADRIRFENLPDPSIIVPSDPSRLKIIFHNLIGNAIKYTDLKKKDPFIKFMCQHHNSHWEFKIVDNGIGIDKEHLNKVFDMYFRASENSKGSGLGLFIVRESINKLNGTIKVESVKGEGTTFIMKFPVK